MKKSLLLVLALATLGCSKTNNQSPQGQVGIGGVEVGQLTIGYPVISLAKNTDTAITMPISAMLSVMGNYAGAITFTFGTLPAAVDSIVPASYTSPSSGTSEKVSENFTFHINAIDTGTFRLAVIASGAWYGVPPSDTIKIIVH